MADFNTRGYEALGKSFKTAYEGAKASVKAVPDMVTGSGGVLAGMGMFAAKTGNAIANIAAKIISVPLEYGGRLGKSVPWIGGAMAIIGIAGVARHFRKKGQNEARLKVAQDVNRMTDIEMASMEADRTLQDRGPEYWQNRAKQGQGQTVGVGK